MFSMGLLRGVLLTGQESIPLFSEFANQRGLEKCIQLHVEFLPECHGGATFGHLFVSNHLTSETANPYRKEMTGEGFAPCRLSLLKRALESALGYSVIEIHKRTFLALDAGRGEITRKTLYEAIPLNGSDTDGSQMGTDCRIGPAEFANFIVFERGSAASFKAATRSTASLEVATEGAFQHFIVDEYIPDNNHTNKKYDISFSNKSPSTIAGTSSPGAGVPSL
jgi:hypothetical protein